MSRLVRMSVVLLLLRVGNSHLLLSKARARCHLTRHERLARRQNRPRYILHISTADLQTAGSREHRGVSALQGL
jgi:hypothetical protein